MSKSRSSDSACGYCEAFFHLGKLRSETVEFPSMAKDDAALVFGERLGL